MVVRVCWPYWWVGSGEGVLAVLVGGEGVLNYMYVRVVRVVRLLNCEGGEIIEQ